MIPRWNSLRTCKHGKLASLGRPPTADGVSAEESERCDNSALGISAPAVGRSGIPAIAAMRVTGEANRVALPHWGDLAGFGKISCVWVTIATSLPSAVVTRVCQTMVRRPRCRGVASPTSSRALWRGADEVGLAFNRGGAAPLVQVCQRSESTQRVCKRHDGPAVQHGRPGAELAAYGHFSHDPVRCGTDNFDPEECRERQRHFLESLQQIHARPVRVGGRVTGSLGNLFLSLLPTL